MASCNQNIMTRFLWAVVLFLSLVKRGQSLSLGTPFDGPNGDPQSDGDRFSILTGSSAILLESFDVHMRNVTATVQVWTRTGFPPYTNPYDFVKRWEGNITGLGQGVATPLPAFNLHVPANHTLGVYVTSKTIKGKDMFHSNGTLVNAVFANDTHISICEGSSTQYIHNVFKVPTKWNGVVHYSVPDQPTPSPTSQPTSPPPTGIPTSTPTVTPTSTSSVPPTLVPPRRGFFNITTGFNSTTVGDGNIFTIKAKIQPISIKGFDIHAAGPAGQPRRPNPAPLEIYFLPGVDPGDEKNIPVYQKIFEGTIGPGAGRNNATPLPDLANPVIVPTGSSYSFYITFTNSTLGNMYLTRVSSVGSVAASDEYVDVLDGYGMVYRSPSYSPGWRWNGNVYYSVEVEPSPPSTINPTVMPMLELTTSHPTTSPTSNSTTMPMLNPTTSQPSTSKPSTSKPSTSTPSSLVFTPPPTSKEPTPQPTSLNQAPTKQQTSEPSQTPASSNPTKMATLNPTTSQPTTPKPSTFTPTSLVFTPPPTSKELTLQPTSLSQTPTKQPSQTSKPMMQPTSQPTSTVVDQLTAIPTSAPIAIEESSAPGPSSEAPSVRISKSPMSAPLPSSDTSSSNPPSFLQTPSPITKELTLQPTSLSRTPTKQSTSQPTMVGQTPKPMMQPTFQPPSLPPKSALISQLTAAPVPSSDAPTSRHSIPPTCARTSVNITAVVEKYMPRKPPRTSSSAKRQLRIYTTHFVSAVLFGTSF